jgi:hypothetical protein
MPNGKSKSKQISTGNLLIGVVVFVAGVIAIARAIAANDVIWGIGGAIMILAIVTSWFKDFRARH